MKEALRGFFLLCLSIDIPYWPIVLIISIVFV